MSLRLFVPVGLEAQAEFDLPPGAARHVQVRRAQPGEALTLFDGRGGEWRAEVLAMRRDGVAVRVLAHDAVEREAARAVTLAVGMPANERMDGLVEKATELGAVAIQPLMTERSVLRLSGERAARKREHWQAVAVAAAEQSGRTRVPAVAPVQRLDEWLLNPPAADMAWLLSPAPGASQPVSPTGSGASVLVLSGPEGGLSAQEEAAATRRGLTPVNLGPRVLRADTAPLAALAWLTLAR